MNKIASHIMNPPSVSRNQSVNNSSFAFDSIASDSNLYVIDVYGATTVSLFYIE